VGFLNVYFVFSQFLSDVKRQVSKQWRFSAFLEVTVKTVIEPHLYLSPHL
jgi:hypothetical protein